MFGIKDVFKKVNYNNGFEDKGNRSVLVGEILSRYRSKRLEPVISALEEVIVRQHGVNAEVQVIGSVARRMATFGSDTDVLIVLPDKTEYMKSLEVYGDILYRKYNMFPKSCRVSIVMGLKADNEEGYKLYD